MVHEQTSVAGLILGQCRLALVYGRPSTGSLISIQNLLISMLITHAVVLGVNCVFNTEVYMFKTGVFLMMSR